MTLPVSVETETEPESSPHFELPNVVLVLLVAASSVGLAQFSNLLSFRGEFATIWLPAGLTLAALAWMPNRQWPVILLGTLIANMVYDVAMHGRPAWVSFGFWIANSTESIVAVLILNLVRVPFRLTSIRESLWFLLGCCLLATMFGATLGAGVVNFAFGGSYIDTWRIWWSGDAIGLAVVFPFLWSLREVSILDRTRRRMLVPDLRTAVLFAVLLTVQVVCTWYTFGRQSQPLGYLAFPALIWLAIRFPTFGSTTGILFTALVTVFHTANDRGLFGAIESLPDRALVLQSFLMVIAATILVLTSVVRQQAYVSRQYQTTMEKLQASYKEHRELMELLPVSLVLADKDRRITQVNAEFQRQFGYEPEEVFGRETRFLYSEAKTFQQLGKDRFSKDARPSNRPYEVEYRKKDGTRFPGQTVGRTILNESGQIVTNVGLIMDVTSRKESELRFRKLVEVSPVAQIAIDRAGRMTIVNSATLELFGYDRHELLGSAVEILIPAEFRTTHIQDRKTYFADMVARNMSAGRIVKGLCKDGSEVLLEIGLASLQLDDQRYALAAVQNVTERVERETQLQKLKEQLQLTVEGGNVGLWDWDIQAGKLNYSDQWHHQLGEQPGSCHQLTDWEARLHPDDVQEAKDRVQTLFASSETSYESTFRMRHKDGGYRWILSRGRLFRTKDGQPAKLMGTHTDITDFRNTQQQLEAFLKVLGRTDGGWSWDMTTDHVDLTPRYRELLGFDGEDVAALPNTLSAFQERIYRDDAEAVAEHMRLHLEEDQPYSIEFRLRMKDGSFRWFRNRGDSVKDSKGRPVRMVGTIYDITDQKESESRLRESNADLAQFASVASHDLKEPLRAIGGFAQLLDRLYADKLDEKGIGYVENIVAGVARMQDLIEDLLGFSSIGRSQQPKTVVDLNQVVGRVADTVQDRLDAVDGILNFDNLPEVSGWPILLQQLFDNLISNAIKFRNPEVPLQIRVSAKTVGDFVVISVVDNGMGIEAKYQDQIFQIFKRLHRREEIPGTGIGLAICERITDRHGGKLGVNSQLGHGSTFTVSLPRD